MMPRGPDLAADTTDTAQRCSDAEREQTSSVVREAAAEGRLTMAELEERLSTIYAARYRHELAAVAADLPTAAKERAGWVAILTLAWHQLLADLSGLFGRGALSRRRKVVLVLALLAAALLLVGLVTMFVHGFAEDGPEHHDFGD